MQESGKRREKKKENKPSIGLECTLSESLSGEKIACERIKIRKPHFSVGRGPSEAKDGGTSCNISGQAAVKTMFEGEENGRVKEKI